ncbi:MAG: methanethiol S-methyltransferase [Candidatus Binatia bacterium]
MSKVAVFVYGVFAYVVFFTTFLYAIGFVGNIIVPKSIDSGAKGSFSQALLINLVLLTLFAIQHSGMARQGFKRWWTRVIPQPIERSTFVLIASLLLCFIFWQWQPLPGVVWDVENDAGWFALQGLFWIGWFLVLLATFMIGHFELFGLEQVFLHLRGKETPPVMFKMPGLYRCVRHPIMLGFIIAFWAAPVMTVGHLLFATVTTIYILIAIQLEERDLMGFFGEAYKQYRQHVSMLIPIRKK